MPEPTRQYIFSARQIKGMFAAVTILMVLGLSALLLISSASTQGTFARADTDQFEAVLEQASTELGGYRELEDGRVQLEIRRAIELVAERGVANPFPGAMAQAQDAAGDEAAIQPADEALEGAAAEQPATAGLPDGSQVYGSCTSCHQANGRGVPGAFPPLAGHAADLYLADPDYLAEVVLFGLQGQITVQGAQYDGFMPDWRSLSDAQIAAVLNFILSSWGNEEAVPEEEPYSAEHIAELRELDLTPQEVHARRSELDIP